MKCRNEHLARRANEEDCCKGRFWESRYKCQALLGEQAVLQCMAYVDLNPARADMAGTPEGSDYTSIQQRSEAISQGDCDSKQNPVLLSMVHANNIGAEDDDTVCHFRLIDYLELVDSTGRAVRDDKRGAISAHASDVLDRLGIAEKTWLAHMRPKRQQQAIALGAQDKLKEYAQMTGRKWISGQRLAGW